MRWFLLLMTVVVTAIAVEAVRWKLNARDIPFREISRLWRGGLDHLNAEERRAFRERYLSFDWGIGQMVWLLVTVAVILVVATVLEFLK